MNPDLKALLEVAAVGIGMVMFVCLIGLLILAWEAYQAEQKRSEYFREVSKRG